MAAAAYRELRYNRSATYGDLAYDLDRETRERELRHAGEVRRETAAAPQVRSIPRVQTRQREHVSALAVAGFAVVAVMAVAVLMSLVQLTELSSGVAKLRGQIATLETENVSLTAKYQQMYDLSSVKKAAEAAGMTKPASSQVYYLDLSDGDSAVVYRKTDSGALERLLTSLSHGVYAVVEYFN